MKSLPDCGLIGQVTILCFFTGTEKDPPGTDEGKGHSVQRSPDSTKGYRGGVLRSSKSFVSYVGSAVSGLRDLVVISGEQEEGTTDS